MSNFFKLDGMTCESQPAITKWGFEDLEDDPTQHRWRASWVRSDYDSKVTGISLTAHPVLKETPCGVWIHEYGFRQATKQPWEEGAPAMEWVPFYEKLMKKRFVHNGSGSAWAKPTQEEAIRSLAIRLSRWSNHVASNVEKLWSAANVMEALRPEYPSYVQHARANMNSVAAIIKKAGETNET